MPEHSFAALTITTLPTTGVLSYAGVPVVAGQVVTNDNLTFLVFTPEPGSAGTPVATFTFQVVDDGGANTANMVLNGSLENTLFGAPSTVIPYYNSTTPPTAADINPPGLEGWTRVVTSYSDGNGNTQYQMVGTNLETDSNLATADTPFGEQFGFLAHVYQTVSGLEPGATYTVSGWAIVADYTPLQDNDTTYFGIEVYDSATFNGVFNYDAVVASPIASEYLNSGDGGAPGWRQVSYTFTAPASGSVGLVVLKESFGAAACNWDNVSLVRAGDGVSVDQTPNVFAINVNPTNDPPVVTLGLSTAANLISNASFETGDLTGWGSRNYLTNGPASIGLIDGTAYPYGPGSAADGTNLVWLNDNPFGTASTALFEDVATVPGVTYTLTYSQNSEHLDDIPNTSAIGVYVDGVLVSTTTFDTTGPQAWQSHTLTFVATGSTTNVEFRDLTNYAANGWGSGSPMIDAIRLTAPAAPAEDYETTFTENGAPVAIASVISTVTDVDDISIKSATIVLTNAMADDVMSIAGSLPTGITATIDSSVAGQVTIALTGSATKADYETAIEAIRFENTSEDPDTTDRIVNVTVNDGYANSNTATATIHVNLVPDPINDTYSGNQGSIISGNVLTNDTDVGTTPSVAQPLALIAGPTNGTLVSFDLATGAFTYTPGATFAPTDSFTYSYTDANGDIQNATVMLNINAPPVLDDPTPGVPGTPEVDATDPRQLNVPSTDGLAATLPLGPTTPIRTRATC